MLDVFNDVRNMDIQKVLEEYEIKISNEIRHIPLSLNWKDNFPDEGGVYVIWENETPIYVGETSGIKSRMGDLSRPVNHPFPKKVAEIYSLKVKGSSLEVLRNEISNRYRLSYLVVSFGRAEIEEYLIIRWRNTVINKSTKRLLNGKQYHWVKAC
ncbi:MAG: hypothetical protein HRU20_07755 [Pseudomonadales bacterium]|nr:hypothetical protein [Pseudomonadales bacterium]